MFHDRIACVRRLVKAEPALLGQCGAALLTQAAARNSVRCASFLIDRGADPDRGNAGGWPPIVWASYRGHVEMVALLIRRGAGVTRDHGNPIHYAGQRGHREICRLLVAAGAIEEAIAKLPGDARKLFRAAYAYDSKTVATLLSKNPALANAVDADGRTALHEACTQGDNVTVQSLLKHAANPRAKDSRGETPIARAQKHRRWRVVRLLKGE